MSSGVRNLRAMFENQGAASPEPRGRSPGDNTPAEEESRPTPKVRASFIAVGPTTAANTNTNTIAQSDLGTTKGTPTNSAAAHRRESFSISEDKAEEIAELKRVVSEEKEERRKSVAIIEAVPEQAVASRESSIPAPPIRSEPEGEMASLGTIMKGSDFPESTVTHVTQTEKAPPVEAEKEPTAASAKEEPNTAEDEPTPAPVVAETPAKTETVQEPTPASPNDAPALPQIAAKTEDEPIQAPTIDAPVATTDEAMKEEQKEGTPKPSDSTDEAAKTAAKTLSPPTEPSRSSNIPKAGAVSPKSAAGKAKTNGTPVAKAKPEIKRPAAISTAKASLSKVAPGKSPLPKSIPRTPTTPKPTAAATTAKPSPAAAKSKIGVPKPTIAKAEAKPAVAKEPAKAAPPKTSRTSLRPGASSSTAAHATSTVPKPKAAVTEQKKPVTAKPAATASTAKHDEEQNLTRKVSTTTRPKATAPGTRTSRPSITPTTAPKRPDSRASTTSTAPKGDFLSRMMRPTTASSSKTHDKPPSPPRKATKAPVAALQKGKKKVEEVTAKAKGALSTNGDDASEHKSNGASAHDEASEAHENHTEAETIVPGEPAKDVAPVQEADVPADVPAAGNPTPQVAEEAVH
ncbi:hypothetical protein GQ44DRAFT_619257 [Phaeosphaeriaceae sp. PMI808]|nr:hypothetical protein GQ44DRAFT_619257 [Phaeosphaeriaceae sp. PMI808]